MEHAPEPLDDLSPKGRPSLDDVGHAPRYLDDAFDAIAGGDIGEGIRRLFRDLRASFDALDPLGWRRLVRAARHHPICDLLQNDPVTRRAFAKPRGSAIDGTLIDWILGIGRLPRDTSCLGARLFAATTEAPYATSLRYRRHALARAIDDAAAGRKGARVLAAGCAHLRELEVSRAFSSDELAEVVALDDDLAAIAHVGRVFADRRVRPVACGSRVLANGGVGERDFDLVYAAGLLDDAPAPLAATITARLFEMLRPGGSLIVTSFAPLADAAYLDAFMDWRPVMRSDDAVEAFFTKIPALSTLGPEVIRDPLGQMIYASVTRA